MFQRNIDNLIKYLYWIKVYTYGYAFAIACHW